MCPGTRTQNGELRTQNSPAIFLDRDGTLVHPRHYPARPEDLVLYEGIGPALQGVQSLGYRLVVITNQSGVARGLFTEGDLGRMHGHLAHELAAFGVHLDAIYFCPHHPDGTVPDLAVRCDCRKPEPGMLLRAADELGIDLTRSWFIGDILDDVEAGNRASCRTILVDLGTESTPDSPLRQPYAIAPDTVTALQIVYESACRGEWHTPGGELHTPAVPSSKRTSPRGTWNLGLGTGEIA